MHYCEVIQKFRSKIFFIMKITNTIKTLLTWSQDSSTLSRRSIFIGLALCLMVAFSIRVFSWHAEPTISRDGIYYIQSAEFIQTKDCNLEKINFITGESELHLYSVYLSCSSWFNITPAQLGLWTNILLGSLLPIILFAIARIVFKNSEMALAVAFLGALHPKLIQYSIVVQREMPYMFCCGMFFLFALYVCCRGRWYWSIGMGFFAATAMFLRHEGAELFVFAIVAFIICFCQATGSRQKKILAAIFFFFSFGVCSVVCLNALHKTPQEYVCAMWDRAISYAKYDDIQGKSQ